MTPEQVLATKPLVLDQRERERYFEDGFLTVPGYVGAVAAQGDDWRVRRLEWAPSRAVPA